MKFRLIDLFIFATASALVVVLFRDFTDWQNYDIMSPLLRNHRHFFSLNILLLTTATLTSLVGYVPLRRFAAGYAAFGWVFLVCLLRGSFVENDNYALWIHGKSSVMGIVYSSLAGIIAYYLLPSSGSDFRKPLGPDKQ